jgi:hypothetical protein
MHAVAVELHGEIGPVVHEEATPRCWQIGRKVS